MWCTDFFENLCSGGGKATRWDLAEFHRHAAGSDNQVSEAVAENVQCVDCDPSFAHAGGAEGEHFTVALQRDCHPTKHFLKLSFVTQGRSAGFVLLETGDSRSSALRGMRIADQFRNQSLSSLFVAIWLHLCLEMGLTPCTTRIDKPIICLLLHKFGFRPRAEAGGVEVQMSRGTGDDSSKVMLFSPTGQALESIFSSQELRSQHIVLRDTVAPSGSLISVKVGFDTPQDLEKLKQVVSAHIGARGGSLCTNASAEVLRLAFLGHTGADSEEAK